jgi:hypothetical protein
MHSPDTPKRRMVVYITEETFAELKAIAEVENRSVSNVAEGKIMSGLRAGPVLSGPALSKVELTGQAREDKKSDPVKVDYSLFINEMPEDTLSILAEKLARILVRAGPVLSDPVRSCPEKPIRKITTSNYSPERLAQIQEVAKKLNSFVVKNKFTQRTFKNTYNLDITSMRAWLEGCRGMSIDTIEKIEEIISNPPKTIKL